MVGWKMRVDVVVMLVQRWKQFHLAVRPPSQAWRQTKVTIGSAAS